MATHSWTGPDTEEPSRHATWLNELEARVTAGGGSGATAKGDIAVGTGSGTVNQLGLGSNDQVLTVDTTTATGTKWAAAPSGATGATGAAGTGSASTIEAQLANSPAAGTTTVTLDRSATAAIAAQNWLVIDAYTSQAEVKKLNSAAGTAVVTVSAMKYAHAANDLLIAVHGNMLTCDLWGCKGDNSTDETTQLQEAINQCGATEVGLWLDGQGKSYVISQPLILPISMKLRHIRLRAAPGFAPADSTNAMVMTMQQSAPITFTADAATDVITTSSAHGLTADGQMVMLKGPSMPTGLTSGRIYFVSNRTATTFKVSLTSGGATIDITAAGSGGDCYPEVNALEKVFLEDVTIDTQVISGLNGASFYLQQPSYTNRLRIDGASPTSTALKLQGQYSEHFNTELNGVTDGDGSTMLDMSGTGHNFNGLILVHGTTGVYIGSGGAVTCTLNGLWTEHFTNGIRINGSTLGLAVNGWLMSYGAVGQVSMRVEAGVSNSYSITGGRGNNGSNEIIHDDARGFTILDSEFPGGAVVQYVQPGTGAPVMPRQPVSVSADYTARICDDIILVSASGATRTITLPTAVSVLGKRYIVKKTDSSGNAVTVATTSSQTIDGVTTKTLAAQYNSVSVVSDGSNWMTV